MAYEIRPRHGGLETLVKFRPSPNPNPNPNLPPSIIVECEWNYNIQSTMVVVHALERLSTTTSHQKLGSIDFVKRRAFK